MTDKTLLGCWGTIVGLLLAAVLGWMTLALVTMGFSVASTDGVGALARSPLFLHELGELLIVAGLCAGVYVAVLRPGGLPLALRSLRPTLWIGAGLQAIAWWGLDAAGLRWWSAALLLLGIAGAPFLRRIAAAGESSR